MSNKSDRAKSLANNLYFSCGADPGFSKPDVRFMWAPNEELLVENTKPVSA